MIKQMYLVMVLLVFIGCANNTMAVQPEPEVLYKKDSTVCYIVGSTLMLVRLNSDVTEVDYTVGGTLIKDNSYISVNVEWIIEMENCKELYR
jgi:hypothetical protein